MGVARGIDATAEPLASFNPSAAKTPRRPAGRVAFMEHSLLHQGYVSLRRYTIDHHLIISAAPHKDIWKSLMRYALAGLYSEVGCAVQTEHVAACELLDEEHPSLPTYSPHDDNAYTIGRIGGHHIIIACLPKGKYGIASAASVAKDMLRSFESKRTGSVWKEHDPVMSTFQKKSSGVRHV